MIHFQNSPLGPFVLTQSDVDRLAKAAGRDVVPELREMVPQAYMQKSFDEFIVEIEERLVARDAAALNISGQCCGVKPIVYKRKAELFCHRCARTFDIDSKKQTANWAWARLPDGMFIRHWRPSVAVQAVLAIDGARKSSRGS